MKLKIFKWIVGTEPVVVHVKAEGIDAPVSFGNCICVILASSKEEALQIAREQPEYSGVGGAWLDAVEPQVLELDKPKYVCIAQVN